MSPPLREGCPEWAVMMHGFIDRELDPVRAREFENHVAGCADCATQLQKFEALKRTIGQDGVRWRIPALVRDRVQAAISLEDQMASRGTLAAGRARAWSRGLQFVKRWSFIPSFAALAASIFLVLAVPRPDALLQDQILASHVRSLLADHLTDVQTSDRHTVKPWFDGKVDYSPPVVDLAAEGFPLVGGRVDYLNGRVVAALVYRRHKHVINVFVWPAAPAGQTDASHDGYNFSIWSSGGLTFWAVSDASVEDLAEFRKLFRERSGE